MIKRKISSKIENAVVYYLEKLILLLFDRLEDLIESKIREQLEDENKQRITIEINQDWRKWKNN